MERVQKHPNRRITLDDSIHENNIELFLPFTQGICYMEATLSTCHVKKTRNTEHLMT